MRESSKEKRRERLLRKPFSAADGLLVLAVIALAAALITQPWSEAAGGCASEVVVEVNGREVMRLPLTEEARDCSVNGFSGESRFRIEGGEVWMVDSACPDKLCVGMGRVGQSGNSVVCLPNRVVLRLEGDGGIDAVQR